MYKKITAYVTQHQMLKQDDKVIVGISGGADSVCLLLVLCELKEAIGFELIGVHVNHGLRGEASHADQQFTEALCKRFRIPCEVTYKNIELIAKNRKQSIEEAGREARREAFQEAACKYGGTKIALAHHQNDNAETFFFNLARGAGLKGLGGMKPVNGQIIRPLLCAERKEIEQYLNQREEAYCSDQTNESDDYTRNRIRRHVIPYLEEHVNRRTVQHISDTQVWLQQIETYLGEQCDTYYQETVQQDQAGYEIQAETFAVIPEVFQNAVIQRVLYAASGSARDITAVHLRQVSELFSKQSGKRIALPYGLFAKRSYEGVRIESASSEIAAEQVLAAVERKVLDQEVHKLPGMTISAKVKEADFIEKCHVENPFIKQFNYDIIKGDVIIRTRRPGDYITIDSQGNRQKLKSYFINRKIPREQRDQVVLIAEGSHILWIVGYRTGMAYDVSKHTKQVLEIQIQIDKGENNGRIN